MLEGNRNLQHGVTEGAHRVDGQIGREGADGEDALERLGVFDVGRRVVLVIEDEDGTGSLDLGAHEIVAAHARALKVDDIVLELVVGGEEAVPQLLRPVWLFADDDNFRVLVSNVGVELLDKRFKILPLDVAAEDGVVDVVVFDEGAHAAAEAGDDVDDLSDFAGDEVGAKDDDEDDPQAPKEGVGDKVSVADGEDCDDGEVEGVGEGELEGGGGERLERVSEHFEELEAAGEDVDEDDKLHGEAGELAAEGRRLAHHHRLEDRLDGEVAGEDDEGLEEGEVEPHLAGREEEGHEGEDFHERLHVQHDGDGRLDE